MEHGATAGRDRLGGGAVTEDQVQAGLLALTTFMSARMRTQSADFRAGTLTAGEWHSLQQDGIKAVQIAAALAVFGGREQMTPARWGLVGQLIRQQYAYQRNFLLDVLEGRQRLNGRLDNRAALYALAAHTTAVYLQRRLSVEQGARYERNITNATESCPDCLQQEALGWVPVGTLSLPGTRRCGANCRCRLETGTHPGAGRMSA